MNKYDAISLILGIDAEFASLDEIMPLQMKRTFLCIALYGRGDEIPMVTLAERMGMTPASVSRNVAALGKLNRHRKPGHGLVLAHDDPKDYRRKLVKLTPKGERLLETITGMLA